ncbi:hypothetical protein NliqN6_0144 [Naganishia liquefaciens]|uniref:Uncharacterized protein n=1 Tax=Naganishia liquefaciens TaxID=104408 RepID=A0A8H3YCY6_9TREE|nr:hypothetical protein NliqN6_0144 [Naganishia liquefaciens]
MHAVPIQKGKFSEKWLATKKPGLINAAPTRETLVSVHSEHVTRNLLCLECLYTLLFEFCTLYNAARALDIHKKSSGPRMSYMVFGPKQRTRYTGLFVLPPENPADALPLERLHFEHSRLGLPFESSASHRMLAVGFLVWRRDAEQNECRHVWERVPGTRGSPMCQGDQSHLKSTCTTRAQNLQQDLSYGFLD